MTIRIMYPLCPQGYEPTGRVLLKENGFTLAEALDR